MLTWLRTSARRSARRALFATCCGLSAMVGAGFASSALYAALREAGQSHAMAGLILACLWFGLSGLFLLLKGAVGQELEQEGAHHPGAAAPHVAHPQGHVATAPGVAEAFMAGIQEGAGFARMQHRRG